MEQTLCLRGANFKVRWTLTEAERAATRATWEGRGPAHSYARTSYDLSARRRRRHALRLRERVQGARRLPRRGGGRVLIGGVPARGAQVARAAEKLLELDSYFTHCRVPARPSPPTHG